MGCSHYRLNTPFEGLAGDASGYRASDEMLRGHDVWARFIEDDPVVCLCTFSPSDPKHAGKETIRSLALLGAAVVMARVRRYDPNETDELHISIPRDIPAALRAKLVEVLGPERLPEPEE